MKPKKFKYLLIHKVGISKKSPSRRRKEVDRSMSGEVELSFQMYCLFPLTVEKCVHDLYSFFRLRKKKIRGVSGGTEFVYGFRIISFLLIVLFNFTHVLILLSPIVLYFLTLKSK